jgi:transposase InsO family protein
VRWGERLVELGAQPSIGSVGDSYDNALAESIIGLFKTEVIKFLGPWKSVGQVEWETLKWVDWYNNTRLHSAIGYVTPQEAEEAFYASLNAAEKVA